MELFFPTIEMKQVAMDYRQEHIKQVNLTYMVVVAFFRLVIMKGGLKRLQKRKLHLKRLD